MTIRKIMFAAALLAGVSTMSLAQTTPSTGATTGTTGSTATHGKMTESQIKSELQKEGYSNVNLKEEKSSATSASATQPEWTGTATKGGKTVNIEVDQNGKVTEK